MVSINYATREVCCKIVYYGPGLSGKTTNLQVVHNKVPQNTRGKLISLATEADRTLYFDFLPINIGSINGFAAKFQLYTVPGQVYYNATRRLVLRGVDGVVFVADSQADKHDDNMESLSNLKENLEEYGYDVNELPIVIQYNKADLPTALSQSELDEKLNEFNWPSYTAAAVDGVGVFDTLKAIMKLVLEKAKKGGSKAKSKPKLMPQEAPSSSGSVAQNESIPASATPVAAQSATAPTAVSAPEPAMAAAHNSGELAREDVLPVGSASPVTGEIKTAPIVKAPTGGGGGLFGSPRPSSGRPRHSANIGSGGIGSGAVRSGIAGSGTTSSGEVATGPVNAPSPSNDFSDSTGEIETVSPEQMQSGALADKNVAGTQETENKANLIGHDPLEQAPPKPKQKKLGFFRRLFGRK